MLKTGIVMGFTITFLVLKLYLADNKSQNFWETRQNGKKYSTEKLCYI